MDNDKQQWQGAMGMGEITRGQGGRALVVLAAWVFGWAPIPAWAAGEVPLPDTGQTTSYTNTVGEDSDYSKPRGYTINGDGTVLDKVTKLQWQQTDDGLTRTWADAKSYCQGLSLAGATDWRLPTIMELSTLVNAEKVNPSIDMTVFPGTQASYYWSSTSYVSYSSYAWIVSFESGNVYDKNKADSNYVRCVRSGQ
jgi:hypothetical protein